MRISLVSVVFGLFLVACAAEDVPTTDGPAADSIHHAKSDGSSSSSSAQADPPTSNATPATPSATTATSTPQPGSGAPKSAATPAAPAAAATPAAKIPLISMEMQFNVNGKDWLMSRTAGEGAPVYHYNGTAYRVLSAPATDVATQPLYRCIDGNGTHFQSNDFGCEGAGTEESLLGYVYVSDPGNGAQPIARCIGSAGFPIVSTIEVADCNPFILQNITLGFAFARTVIVIP